MICMRCLAQQPALLAERRQSLRIAQLGLNSRGPVRMTSSRLARSFSCTPAKSDATKPFSTPPAASISARPLSTSSSASSPSKANTAADGATGAVEKSGSVAARSGTPAGTILRGLNFHKDKSDPLAMEDKEYPDWLWTVLDEVRAAGGKDKKGESAKASKKKDRKGVSTVREVIPVHRQTIDLPASDGTDAGIQRSIEATAAVTKAMRAERRAKIKENNFLRTMN